MLVRAPLPSACCVPPLICHLVEITCPLRILEIGTKIGICVDQTHIFRHRNKSCMVTKRENRVVFLKWWHDVYVCVCSNNFYLILQRSFCLFMRQIGIKRVCFLEASNASFLFSHPKSNIDVRLRWQTHPNTIKVFLHGIVFRYQLVWKLGMRIKKQ